MVDVPPADHGFGLFGPDFGVPLGGFCLSVFVLVERDGGLLVGRMAPDDRWEQAWQPNMVHYEGDRYDALFDGLRLPSTYLREGEHPADAAARVWTDQLGLPGTPDLGSPGILSEAAPSRRAPEANHWDVAFLYAVDGPDSLPDPPAHWASLDYAEVDALDAEAFVMLHGEILAHLPM